MYDSLITGVAIMIPVVVTLYIVSIAIGFVRNALDPLIRVLRWAGLIQRIESGGFVQLLIEIGIYADVVAFVSELIAIAVLVLVIAVVGVVGRNRYGQRVVDVFDLVVSSIPGVGTVYKSFRRMGDVVLDEQDDKFQDVKLVRCFDENVYVLGFKTGEAPVTIEESTGHEEMVSMFLPLAPNPVTGGLLTYIPQSDVHDIDMTIEEGIQSVLTSGVATDQGASGTLDIGLEELQNSQRYQDIRSAVVTTDYDDEDGE
ncbi:DUF502 domain-containing protein [Halorubrum distributum]|uniref:DUF502 domain-containing protein n=1 Tax=Halorubrum distributum JCM 13916 TaxID=1230455 RepID=M0PQL9_9EURY|nr:DUF502 domain-containing protein [Halorubrum arcis]EMA72251.1 hypothetical protein C462_01662 [Halorubrum arcis JCM 13916]